MSRVRADLSTFSAAGSGKSAGIYTERALTVFLGRKTSANTHPSRCTIHRGERQESSRFKG